MFNIFAWLTERARAAVVNGVRLGLEDVGAAEAYPDAPLAALETLLRPRPALAEAEADPEPGGRRKRS